MTIETPEFQGTHLWNRLHWAKDNLDGVQTAVSYTHLRAHET